jgi:hypothetical protein
MNFAVYKRLIVWWVSVLLIATSVFWANYFGLIQTIWDNDPTRVTSIISFIFIGANLSLGWLAWKASDPIFVYANRKLMNKITDYNWFISEMLMALGMFGTVIGLIHMLQINAAKDVADTTALGGMIAGMWKAMGLALYANAVGLAASIVLKFQISAIGIEDEA